MSRSSLNFVAETFLRILHDDPDRSTHTEAYYVQNAARYGVPAERIAELSGVPLNRVANILAEAS